MPKYVVRGKKRLEGVVKISGSKNAALPIICSSLLSSEPCVYSNVPDLSDVRNLLFLLNTFGVEIDRENDVVKIDPGAINSLVADYQIVSKMRASVLNVLILVSRGKFK